MSTSNDPLGGLLAREPFVLLDGGLATELETAGHDLGDPLWSARVLLDDPRAIERVHRRYFEAGADVATTATYQVTFEGLARRGLDHEAAAAVMREAILLARRARDAIRPDGIVAGSIGSYGAFLADGSEYRGDYELRVAELVAFHRPRAESIAAHADMLACETIPCRNEALALAEVLQGLPGAHAWVSFSCRDEAYVWSGEPIEACVHALDGVAQVSAIGVNCGAPRAVETLVRRVASATDKPIVAYPNGTEGFDRDRGWTGEVTPEAFAQLAAQWVAAGARVLGGCCRTTPAHIEALARWRDRERKA